MTKSQEEMLHRCAPYNKPYSNIRGVRSTTPEPTIVDENTPPPTSTPNRLVRLMDSSDALSIAGCPDTPSRHISCAKVGGIKDLGNLAISTLVAHQFIQKLNETDSVVSKGDGSNEEFPISSHLDFIRSNIAYKAQMDNIPVPPVKSFSKRTMVHNIDFSQMLESDRVTRETEVLFPSKAYTAKICSLGTYKEIGDRCSSLVKNYKISDQELAEYIGNIYNNATPKNIDLEIADNKFLLDFSTLLYATEGHRHQSAYIMHKMFIDLVKEGKYCFRDMHKILPMAIEGAVSATIMLDKILFIKNLKDFTLYYNKSSTLITSQDKIEEFVCRTNKIVSDWLEQEEFSGSTPQEKYDFIKEHLVDWYGSSSVVSQDDKDISSSILSENADSYYEDSPYQNTRKRKYSRSEGESPNSKRQKTTYEMDCSANESDQDSSIDYDSPSSSPSILGKHMDTSWDMPHDFQ